MAARSTGSPPAADVASIRTSWASACAGLVTGTITPVEVSFWAQASTSTPGSEVGSGASPGSAATITGSARNGALRVQAANFEENSP